jgi:hypothetical protein
LQQPQRTNHDQKTPSRWARRHPKRDSNPSLAQFVCRSAEEIRSSADLREMLAGEGWQVRAIIRLVHDSNGSLNRAVGAVAQDAIPLPEQNWQLAKRVRHCAHAGAPLTRPQGAWQNLIARTILVALFMFLARVLLWAGRRLLGLTDSQRSWQIFLILFPYATRIVATGFWRALHLYSALPLVHCHPPNRELLVLTYATNNKQAGLRILQVWAAQRCMGWCRTAVFHYRGSPGVQGVVALTIDDVPVR